MNPEMAKDSYREQSDALIELGLSRRYQDRYRASRQAKTFP
jgi:hypothetical protein